MTDQHFDSVTIAGMKLCAARNDAALDAGAFIALISDFARAVAAEIEPEQTQPVAAKIVARDPTNGEAKRDKDQPRRATPSKGNRGRLSYDDKVRIKSRHDAELEARGAAGSSRPRSGFVQELAAEYGVSDSTIYTIVSN